MSNTWKIAVNWEMAGIVEVSKDKFPTIEVAMDYVRNEDNPIALPTGDDAIYVEGSWSLSCEEPEIQMLYNKK